MPFRVAVSDVAAFGRKSLARAKTQGQSREIAGVKALDLMLGALDKIIT